MRFIRCLSAALALGAAPALAADPAGSGKLTYVEVFNIGQALKQLGDYADANRQTIKVPFKFDGSTLMSIAVNIRAADEAEKVYREAYVKFETKELGDVKDAKPEDLQRRRLEIAATAAAAKLTTRPAGVSFSRIKESELCTKSPPIAPCRTTNDIPPVLLAVILPIIDRGQ